MRDPCSGMGTPESSSHRTGTKIIYEETLTIGVNSSLVKAFLQVYASIGLKIFSFGGTSRNLKSVNQP
jgi:hypothetical protein